MEKPIERSFLERILKRNIPAEKIRLADMNGDISQKEVQQAVTEEPDAVGLDTLKSIEGMDTEQGILYCNGEEGYLSILRAYCEDWEEAGALARDSFEKKDWKNYTVAVHGLKSAMFSIGAVKVFEMAKQLEMAGKEGNISYIEEHHRELMDAYAELFTRLRDNKWICPESKSMEEESMDLPEIPETLFEQIISNMEEAVYVFDSDILTELMEELEGYNYKGNSLKKILAPVRRKIEMSDLISAVEMVAEQKKYMDGRENETTLLHFG